MAYAKGHGFVKVEDSMVTVQTKGLGKTRVTVPVSQISGVELKKPTITKGGTFTLRVPGKMGGYIIQFRQGQYSQFVEVQEAIFAAMSSLRGVSAISEPGSNAMDKEVASARIPVIEAKNETLAPVPSSSLGTPQTSTESTLEDAQQIPVVMNKKGINSHSKLWLNIFLTIITIGFWLPIWGILILLRRNPSLSASFHRWYISTESTRSRFRSIINKIPMWVGIPIIFFGAVFRDHKVSSTLKTQFSLVEDFGSAVLVGGLILFGLQIYLLVAKWQNKRGMASTLKTRTMRLLVSFVTVVAIFGVFDSPASALRWKLDPSAKVQYLASVRQATQDLAISEKQMATSTLNPKPTEDVRSATNSNAESLALKTPVGISSQEPVERITKTDATTIRNVKKDLGTYLDIWTGYVNGVSKAYEVDNACTLLGFDYDVLREVHSPADFLEDLLTSTKDKLWEAKDRCAYSIKHNDLQSLGDAVPFARQAIGGLDGILKSLQQ